MSDFQDRAGRTEPFVHEEDGTRSLHFTYGELQSRMHLQRPDALEVEYTRTMMGFLLFKCRPRSIVMIGLGGGSLAKFCYRHLPGAQITAVEINPQVIALREQFLVPGDDARLRIVQADGADFVAEAASPCDVLLVDGFDRDGMPPRLCTQGFYDDCHCMLSAGGIMVANLHVEHPEYAIFVDRIVRSFEGSVLVVNIRREGNAVVFASRGDLVAQQAQGIIRQPTLLGKAAWTELKPTFAQILTSLAETHGH